MLHAKFQGHRLFGSREEDFLRFSPYMGMAAILVMWPWLFELTFFPPTHGGSIWNSTSIGPVASEEKMFKNVDVRLTTDSRGMPILYWVPLPTQLYFFLSIFKTDNNLKNIMANYHLHGMFIFMHYQIRFYVRMHGTRILVLKCFFRAAHADIFSKTCTQLNSWKIGQWVYAKWNV